MVKERWIENRLKYLSSEGKKFSLFFLISAIVIAIAAALFVSKCALILSVILFVSGILSRAIAFIAGQVVKLIATAIWPPAVIHDLQILIEIHQFLLPSSVFTPLSGVPRVVLQS